MLIWVSFSIGSFIGWTIHWKYKGLRSLKEVIENYDNELIICFLCMILTPLVILVLFVILIYKAFTEAIDCILKL